MKNMEVVQEMFADLAKADEEAEDMFAVDPATKDIRRVSRDEAEKQDLLTITPQEMTVS